MVVPKVLLRRLLVKPIPCREVHPGVTHDITTCPEPLAQVVDLQSPYRALEGVTCPHLVITDAGRRLVEDDDAR